MLFYFGRTVTTFSYLQGMKQSGINSQCFILECTSRNHRERTITGGLCDVNYDAIFSTVNVYLLREGALGDENIHRIKS